MKTEPTVAHLLSVLRGIDPGGCREWPAKGETWPDGTYRCCGEPAEFVLWGKLLDAEALGPRCYDHAAEHVGHRALGDRSWAIINLRPLRRVLDDGGHEV